MRVPFFRLWSLLVSALFVSSICIAQEPSRGRLNDGRAYRTDDQGNQLVDYIAELEINIESLNRRIIGLEDELTEKNVQLERASHASPQPAAVKERDLGGSASQGARSEFVVADNKSTCPACPKVECPVKECPVKECAQLVCPEVECPEKECPVQECPQQVCPLTVCPKTECPRVECPRVECPDKECPEVVCPEVKCPELDCSPVEAAADEKIEQLKDDFDAKSALAKKEVEGLKSELASLQRDVDKRAAGSAELRQKLDEAASRIMALQANLREAQEARQMAERERDEQKQLALEARTQAETAQLAAKKAVADYAALQATKAQMQLALEQSQAQAAKAAAALASKNENTTRQPVAVTQRSEEVSGSLMAARSRVVDSLRGRLDDTMSQLKSSISMRDDLYHKFSQKKHAIAFKPSELVSTRGVTLKDISKRINEATTVYELSALSKELNDIKLKVEDDIGLMKRIDKMS